ncbi:MAG: zf-TFIIB domain-containing protein [Isosphaeraceae bacterium]
MYDCPNCDRSLKSSLEDAGIMDHCPHCDLAFIVPGQSYRQKNRN